MATKYIAPRGLKDKGYKPYWERETIQKATELSSQHKVSRSGFGGRDREIGDFEGFSTNAYDSLGNGSYLRKNTSSD